MAKKRGQPTSYKDTYPSLVTEHLAQGFTLAAWAGEIGVCRTTVYNWSDEHPEFLYAIKKGRAKGQGLWESRLASQAVSGKGNTAAIIFAMKNLYQDDWSDKIITEHQGKVTLDDETTRDFARRMAFVFAQGANDDRTDA